MNLFSSNVSAIIGSAYKNFLKKMKLNRFMNNIIISINVFNIDSICTDTDRVFNCLYLYVCHPVCPSMCLPSCVSVYVSAILCVRLYVCHPVCPSMCLPSCLSVYVSAILCVRLCVCHPVCPSMCLSYSPCLLSLYIYLFIPLDIYPS